MPPPPVEPPPGHVAIDPFPAVRAARSFVSDTTDGDRLRVAYFKPREGDGLAARAWFGPGSQGPPGFAHGGAVAAVLDEAMGAAAWLAGYPTVVARLVVDMRAMVPLGTDATLEARVVSADGRKVTCRAQLGDGSTIFAEGEALCIVLRADQVADFKEKMGWR